MSDRRFRLLDLEHKDPLLKLPAFLRYPDVMALMVEPGCLPPGFDDMVGIGCVVHQVPAVAAALASAVGERWHQCMERLAIGGLDAVGETGEGV